MAVKNYRVAATTSNNTGDIIDGVDQTAATRTDGWTSAKIASALASDFDAATKQASGTFVTNTTRPSALIVGTTANAFGTTAPLSGVFAAASWVFTFAVRATTASSQAGRMRLRVYRSVNATGSGATELTGATQVGTTSSVLSTTADVTSVVTWTPGATITLNNEYLFFVIAWEITTAGGSNSADVQIRTGQSAAGSFLTTPSFTANYSYAVSDNGMTPAATSAIARTATFQRALSDNGLTFGVDTIAVQRIVPRAISDNGLGSGGTAVVGVAQRNQGTNSPASFLSPCTVKNGLTMALRVGNLGANPTVSDDINGPWTLARSQQQTTDGHTLHVFVLAGGAAGSPTITVTNPGGGTLRWLIQEWSGVATSSLVRAGTPVSAQGAAPLASGDFTAQAGDLVYGAASNNNGNSTAWVAGGTTAGGAWTLDDTFGAAAAIGTQHAVATATGIFDSFPTTPSGGGSTNCTSIGLALVPVAAAVTDSIAVQTSRGIRIGKIPGVGGTGLTGAWQLSENPAVDGTVIADSSSGGDPGTLTTNEGATNKSVPGQYGTAITFDGVDDVIDVPASVFGFGTGDFTVAASIRNTSQATPSTLFAQDLAGTFGPFVLVANIDINNGNFPGKLIAIVFASDSVFYSTETAPGVVAPNVWHRVVYRRASGVISMWVDGVSIALTPQSFGGATGGVSLNNVGTFRIGARHYSGAFDPFTGDIDDVRLYSRALSDAEIIAGVGPGTVVRGVNLLTGIPVGLGRVASTTTVRGATLTGTGTAAVTIGRRAAAATVRGVTLVGTGTGNPVPIGKRAAATTVRGVTAVGSGAATPVLIGRRAAASTVFGVGGLGPPLQTVLVGYIGSLGSYGADPYGATPYGGGQQVRGVTLGRAPFQITDTGLALTDSLQSFQVLHRQLADTGLAVTSTLVASKVAPRTITQTGLTITDSVARTKYANPAVSDTGLTVADTLVRQPVTHSLAISQVGLAITESIAVTRSFVRGALDTGMTPGDSIVRTTVLGRAESDAGLNMSVPDSIAMTARHGLLEFGLALTDSLLGGKALNRAVADTGLNVSSSISLVLSRSMVDAGLTPAAASSIQAAVYRKAVDTGLTVSDSVASVRARQLADTGLTAGGGSSLASATLRPRTLADTGLVLTDALRATSTWGRADTGLSISDSIFVLKVSGTVQLADAGLAVTDAVKLTSLLRALSDTGLAIADSLVKQGSGVRTAVDNGMVFSEALATLRSRPLTDTGLTIGSSLAAGVLRARAVTDNGLTPAASSATTAAVTRAVTDTGLTVSSSIVETAIRGPGVADIGLAISDSLRLGYARQLVDTGLALSDVMFAFKGKAVADTGMAFSESLVRTATHPRVAADTGLTITDQLGLIHPKALADTGLTVASATQVAVSRSLADTMTISDAFLVRHVVAITDLALSMTDHVTKAQPLTLSESGLAISDVLRRSALVRVVADIGLAIADSLRDSTFRYQGDTGLGISESIQVRLLRGVADTGLTVSDQLTAARARTTTIADVGLILSDSIAAGRLRSLGDLALDISEKLPILVARRGLIDAFRVTDVLHLRSENFLPLFDVGLVLSDTLERTELLRVVLLVDTGLLFSDELLMGWFTKLVPPLQAELVTQHNHIELEDPRTVAELLPVGSFDMDESRSEAVLV